MLIELAPDWKMLNGEPAGVQVANNALLEHVVGSTPGKMEVRSKLTVKPPTPVPPTTDSNPVTGAVVKSLIVEPDAMEKSVDAPDTVIACVAPAQVLAPLKLKQYVLPPRLVTPSAGPAVLMVRMPPSPVGSAVAKEPDAAKVQTTTARAAKASPR